MICIIRHQAACSAHESLRAFSRITNDDATRVVEHRLQKLWSGPSEVMVSSRSSSPPSSSSSPLSRHPTLSPSTHSEAWTADKIQSQLKLLNAVVGQSHKPDAQDWRAAVSRTPQLLQTRPLYRGGDAAVRALADRSLWTTMTEFMTGLPFAILQFEKYAVPQYSIQINKTAAYKSKVFFPLDEIIDWFPKPVGLLPQLAIAEGNLGILQMLFKLQQSPHYRAHPKLHFGEVLRCAIWFKCWKILQWLVCVLPYGRDWQWEPDLMSYAVFQRNFALMNWLFVRCPSESITLSARQVEIRESGELEMVKWLHEHGYSFSVWMMNGAAAKGRLAVVQFLHEYCTEGCTTDAMDLAARYGHVEIVKFLHTNRVEGCTLKALDGAAQNGNIEIVEFLVENREEGCIASAIEAAKGNNKCEVVKYLRSLEQ